MDFRSVVPVRATAAAVLAVTCFALGGVRRVESGETSSPALRPPKAPITWLDAAPAEKVQQDWLLQDAGPDASKCFTSDRDAATETRIVDRVVEELADNGGPFRDRLERLLADKRPAEDPAWRKLYVDACQARRQKRLRPLVQKYHRIVYTKHYNIGGSHYAYTENPTDAQRPERNRTNPDWRMGAELCLLQISADGRATSRVLLEEPDGLIRDPDVSYDGRRVVFARRDTAFEDDFHLYELDVTTENVRQLTFGLGFADVEPAYLAHGDIIFTSTRCMQITDCFWTDVANLYMCNNNGRFLRRVGFDQVHTNYPKALEDGRVIYTRWDYNDRGQIYPQPLFVMNADGTSQTEFYGNNSWFPTTIMHARGIPGTQKLVAVASGHHSHQRGKLILIDPASGNQEADGIQLIAPVRETLPERIDAYGQEGDQFQYPYPLDETKFLVTYDPIGSPRREYNQPYGIYLMDIDGRRELLAWDATISCNQPIPLAARATPHPRPSSVDYGKKEGTYYIQDIYAGEALAGVPRGTIKKLRVVALEYRAAGIRSNNSRGPAGGALSSTPVSIGNGCWDVKVVLGDAAVHDDGSAWFAVPVRTPVYFQALDEKNRAVQTMRSWSTLQPGENASCVGCHEKKKNTPLTSPITLATAKGPQRLKPFYGAARGFSFEQELQPIFDHRCVECHDDRTKTIDWDAPATDETSLSGRAFSLLGNTTDDEKAGRQWADSYLALTGAVPHSKKNSWQGHPNRLVNWITSQSEPSMLPPYHTGSTQSGLYTLLERGHAGVQVPRAELDRIACWIDLGVPYCGDYTEASLWTNKEIAEYAFYQAKRDRMSEIEAIHLERHLASHRDDGQPVDVPPTDAPPTFDAGGPVKKQSFVDAWLTAEIPVHGVLSDKKNVYRNLALNSNDTQGGATCYPHASSNSEYKSMPCFAARNAIDGQCENRGHGRKYPSWGPHKRTDLWWKLEFGRPVAIDKVVLFIRADFPHDDYWRSATIEFSDGSQEPISLEKTASRQEFSFKKRTVTWLRLTDLVEELPLDWCALTEVEVWGRDVEP